MSWEQAAWMRCGLCNVRSWRLRDKHRDGRGSHWVCMNGHDEKYAKIFKDVAWRV